MNSFDRRNEEFKRQRQAMQNFNYDAAKLFIEKHSEIVYTTCEFIENLKLEYNAKTFNTILPDGSRPKLRFYKIPSCN